MRLPVHTLLAHGHFPGYDTPMNEPAIQLRDVSFFYLDSETPEDLRAISTEELSQHLIPVFEGFNVDIPRGSVSLIGENGVGKSTLMLLASARLFPVSGSIHMFGVDTASFKNPALPAELEAERNNLVSMLYQNMELESEDSLNQLLETVLAQGNLDTVGNDLEADIRSSFDMNEIADKALGSLSKGQSQRALLALAAAYGSQMLFLDEPVFAMEEHQKHKALDFFLRYAETYERSVVFSAHEIDLCRRYSQSTVLLQKDQDPKVGSSTEICSSEVLEEAFRAPMHVIQRQEHMYRDMLVRRFVKDN